MEECDIYQWMKNKMKVPVEKLKWGTKKTMDSFDSGLEYKVTISSCCQKWHILW